MRWLQKLRVLLVARNALGIGLRPIGDAAHRGELNDSPTHRRSDGITADVKFRQNALVVSYVTALRASRSFQPEIRSRPLEREHAHLLN